MKWLVRLSGHEFDIKDLVNIFSLDNDISIEEEKENDGTHIYFLMSKQFSNLETQNEVKEAAEKIINQMNAIGAISISSFQPINRGTIESITSDGKRSIFIEAQPATGRTHAYANITVTSANGDIVENNNIPTQALWFKKGIENEKVRKVFELISKNGLHDWGNLYSILEEIESDNVNVVNRGWISNTQRRNFKQIAQFTRHGGKSDKDLPKNPMTLKQAEELIKGIIVKWLNEK